jgi:hypothetical protein
LVETCRSVSFWLRIQSAGAVTRRLVEPDDIVRLGYF